MKTIKDVVVELGGRWPEQAKDSEWFIVLTKKPDGSHSELKLKRSEFEACAKRMGYINGYLWGKEYPTNGKRPDLPKDTRVSCKVGGEWEYDDDYSDEVDYWNWPKVQAFKVLDPRYKPVDELSEIAESINKAEYVSEISKSNDFEMNENSWHERGEIPPSGTYCQFQLTDGTGKWVNCFVIGVDDLGFCVCRADMDYFASMSASSFRPSSHTAKK